MFQTVDIDVPLVRHLAPRRTALLAALLLAGPPPAGAAESPPASLSAFRAYPAKAWAGPAAEAAARSRPAGEFRSHVSEALAGRPNFAGRWSVVGRGCGTGCTTFALVDHANGRVVRPEAMAAVYAFGNACRGEKPLRQVWYRADSRLLVKFDSFPDRNRWQAQLWDGRRLKPLKTVAEQCPR